jgi:hypothetical protein
MMALCTSLVLSHAPQFSPGQKLSTLTRRIPPIHMAATMTLTVTLVGCANGVGVGLDPSNVVDMLREGSPAERELQRGDKVLQWNGIAMVDPDSGQPRKLKDVVVPSDVHTLVVERIAQSAPKSTAAPPQAARTSEWKSTTDYKSHSWQSTESWSSDSKWG